jgi:ABC-type Zn uptake system ZnuABC Zn-binding protein ZnuA
MKSTETSPKEPILMSLPALRHLVFLFVLTLSLAACGAPSSGAESTSPTLATAEDDPDRVAAPSALPTFTPVTLTGNEKLQVVATTNVIADVVGQVGGDTIDLYAMLPVGADPHSYQPTPQDLRMLTDAHVVFINGLGLEEAMALALEDYAGKSVVINTGVNPVESGNGAHETGDHRAGEASGEEHAHENIDPHTWFSVHAVQVWARNVAQVLSALDPANASAYTEAAAAYGGQLETLHDELETQVAQIPPEQRKLVTDHDSLGYLAAEYGFQIIASVVPSSSTLAEPSAQQLAALQDQITAAGVKAIFVSTTVNPQMERQLAEDLGITVVAIYTGSLSEAEGPAATYIDFMRYNVGAIVAALQ